MNETSSTNVSCGVDVVYKTARKTFTCIPLFCPARVVGTKTEDTDVYVGSWSDGKNAYPITAVYDSLGTFKNLSKGRYVVHSSLREYALLRLPTTLVTMS